MSFWSKIGLASKKEVTELKKEMINSQVLLKEEMQHLFREQTLSHSEAIESLRSTFLEATNQLELKQKYGSEELRCQLNGIETKIANQLANLSQQGQDLQKKIDLVQEIAKIQWASTLIDYVDELLEGTGEKMISDRSTDDPAHPYHYDFGEVTRLFQYVCRATERAGFHIGWRNTKQAVQFYLRKEDGEQFENQIGAIQYEGSNDFLARSPNTVTWRFTIKNMPDALVQDLSSILSKNQAALLQRGKDTIFFRFYTLDGETKTKINRITETLTLSAVK